MPGDLRPVTISCLPFFALAPATGINYSTPCNTRFAQKSVAWHLSHLERRGRSATALRTTEYWARHWELFCLSFQRAGIDSLNLVLTVTWICNRKPLLAQGLCSKWFSGPWVCSFTWFSQLLWELHSTRILNPRIQKAKGK